MIVAKYIQRKKFHHENVFEQGALAASILIGHKYLMQFTAMDDSYQIGLNKFKMIRMIFMLIHMITCIFVNA